MLSPATIALLGAAGTAMGSPVPQEPMVVTASRARQPLSETLASVTLISRDDIERSQAPDLLELLRLQSGVELSRTGGPGQQTSLFLRGTESNHVLVLIDGVRANSLQNGAFTWENLPLSQVERIEIVRGPHASYYGSEAVGGVIQVFTRQPEGPQVSARAGSYGTREGSVAMGGGDDVRWRATAGWRDADGFSAQNPDGFSFDPDDDGYENRNLGGGLTVPLDGGSLRFNGLFTDAEVEFDQGVTDTDTTNLGGEWRGERQSLRIGFYEEQRETPTFDNGFESRQLSADWQFQGDLGGGYWTAGLNYRHEDGESYSIATGATGFGDQRDNVGLFAGLRVPFGQWETEISARRDENSEFGGHTTGQATLARSLGDATRVRASVGTAFRGPNLNEQFSPGFGGQFQGNPDLEPEESRNVEIGLQHRLSDAQGLNVSLYRNEVDNLIAFQGENFRAVNIREATVDGLEANWDWRADAWQVNAALTLQDTEDEASGRSLLRRADEKLALTVDRRFDGSGNLGAEVVYHGERRAIAGTLDAYTLVNLRARWPLGDAWSLEGRVENLLDEDYELAAGFNTPGASVYLGVSWRSR